MRVDASGLAEAPGGQPLMGLSGVSRVYQGRAPVTALADVNLVIHAGETIAVTGPSGSGKSTLLHLLGGLDLPTSGRVTAFGANLSALSEDDRARLRRRNVGYVFQAYHLMPTLTCAENVALPLHLQGIASATVSEAVTRALASVGLADRSHHLPDALSGGERQRVAIARALVTSPRLLLADEPTGNLDSATGARILQELVALQRSHGATLVIVTHDPRVAAACQRVIRLEDGRVLSDDRAC